MTPDEALIVANLGIELYRAALTKPLGALMQNPEPGDLVVEVSSFKRSTDPDSVGRLLRVEYEDGDEPYVIEPLHRPGEEQRWRNASFVALPEPSWGRAGRDRA